MSKGGSGLVPNDSFFNLPGGYVANYVWSSSLAKGLILDAGCGYGYGTDFLAQNTTEQVVGIDIDKKAIKYALNNYKRSNLTFFVSDILKADLRQKFDTIVSFEVLEHLLDPDKYLQKIMGALKTGGHFLLSTPNRKYTEKFYINGKTINYYHVREYYPKEVKTMLSQYFQVVAVYRHYHPERLLNNRDVDLVKKQLSQEIKIPVIIRKNTPSFLKNLLHRALGSSSSAEYCGRYKEFHIEQVANIEEITEQYQTQMYHCIKDEVI